MAKSNSQKVQESKARRVARGQRILEVWVPADDEVAIAEIRARADRACKDAELKQSEPPPTE